MAHFAEIDPNTKVVTRVIVVADSDCGGGSYPESDPIGAAFCNQLLGGTWKQTSYNNNFRKNYAGVGYTFHEDIDAFVSPRPYSSWNLNEETGRWEAPVPMPSEGSWEWDEDERQWNELIL